MRCFFIIDGGEKMVRSKVFLLKTQRFYGEGTENTESLICCFRALLVKKIL